MGSKCGRRACPQPGLNSLRQVHHDEYFEKRKAKECEKNSRELEAVVARLRKERDILKDARLSWSAGSPRGCQFGESTGVVSIVIEVDTAEDARELCDLLKRQQREVAEIEAAKAEAEPVQGSVE